MKLQKFISVLALSAFVLLNAESNVTASDLVASQYGAFGQNKGKRAVHSKGMCVSGYFVPNKKDISKIANVPFLDEKKIPAMVRFSNGSGNPMASDTGRAPRGIAISIESKKEAYELVMLSEPIGFASSRESFVSFFNAISPDPKTKKPNPDNMKAHIAKYPEAEKRTKMQASHPASTSYASATYFSQNAFKFMDKKGKATFARIVLEPKSGTKMMTEDEEKTFSKDFLKPELTERIADKPVEFTIFAHIKGKNDNELNATQEWSSKEMIPFGTLVINKTDGENCEAKMFIPTTLPKGIEPSDDEILKARADAYAVSFGKRME